MSVVDAHLEIDPENVIEFILVDTTTSTNTSATTSTSNSPQKVVLTLKNPDVDGLPIAFKVRCGGWCCCVCCWEHVDIRCYLVSLLPSYFYNMGLSHTTLSFLSLLFRSFSILPLYKYILVYDYYIDADVLTYNYVLVYIMKYYFYQ